MARNPAANTFGWAFKKNFNILLISVGHLDHVSVSDRVSFKKIVFNRDMRPWLYLERLFQVLRAVWKFKPKIILGWMYIGNIFAAIAKCLRPTAAIFWALEPQTWMINATSFKNYQQAFVICSYWCDLQQ